MESIQKSALESRKFLNQELAWAKTHNPFALFITGFWLSPSRRIGHWRRRGRQGIQPTFKRIWQEWLENVRHFSSAI